MALCWLSLRLVDVLAELSLKRLQRVHRSGDTALVRLINRLLKAASVIVAVLVLPLSSDVDLTAALTGLGVGGIAIGFGAQKTIENLFGGHHGDFGQAGQRGGRVQGGRVRWNGRRYRHSFDAYPDAGSNGGVRSQWPAGGDDPGKLRPA